MKLLEFGFRVRNRISKKTDNLVFKSVEKYNLNKFLYRTVPKFDIKIFNINSEKSIKDHLNALCVMTTEKIYNYVNCYKLPLISLNVKNIEEYGENLNFENINLPIKRFMIDINFSEYQAGSSIEYLIEESDGKIYIAGCFVSNKYEFLLLSGNLKTILKYHHLPMHCAGSLFNLESDVLNIIYDVSKNYFEPQLKYLKYVVQAINFLLDKENQVTLLSKQEILKKHTLTQIMNISSKSPKLTSMEIFR